MWGARGGNSSNYGGTTYVGGYGGYVSGTIMMNTKMNFYVYIGGQGTNTDTGGWNGGGYLTGGQSFYGGSGGGASDIRTISGSWNNDNSLRSRILVAGAGGGGDARAEGYGDGKGGDGGGLYGIRGQAINHTNGYGYCQSSGGTQVSGGQQMCYGEIMSSKAKGYFGAACQNPDNSDAWAQSGGGSGWYGGSASNHSGAGGGSSYISGHTGCVGVTSLTDTTPKSGCTTGTTNNACSLSPTGLSFTDTVMIDGAGYSWTNVKGSLQQMPNPSGGYYASGVGHTGNGAARITRLN
ncbi:hypothetical protein IJJ12_03270 [bacterium]|nr:hypothetical protein [bacterium]